MNDDDWDWIERGRPSPPDFGHAIGIIVLVIGAVVLLARCAGA